jgi:hypothetical protein
MRHPWTAFSCLLLIVVSDASLGSAQPPKAAPTWSSAEPLSIPFAARMRQLDSGNIVVNPSFESGRRDGKARRGEAFALPGWQAIGSGVEWVHPGARGYAPEEANDGRCAIRIRRQKADEVGAADGVLSGYLPVIPGNYDFSYAVRLQDVAGRKRRLGTRLQDAVTVKVMFFDRKKNPLDAAVLNPVSGTRVDSSNKSLAFGGNWAVAEFPWSRVKARTANYPFSEGDIPDAARFVRLFLGLSGTGTLWLDAVDFRYSKWNFTALERMRPHFDKPLDTARSLIPTPRSVRVEEEIRYYDARDEDSAAPVIVIPDEPAPVELTAANVLKNRLEQAIRRAAAAVGGTAAPVRIMGRKADPAAVLSSKLVFAIGNNCLLEALKPDLPVLQIAEHPQGYVILSRPAGACRVVFLYGETPAGNFNAACTAVQLLDEERCVFRSAAVIDYPDFAGRSFIMPAIDDGGAFEATLDQLERLSLYKLNKAYAGTQGHTPQWYHPTDSFRRGMAALGRACRQNGAVELAVMINPYTHFDYGPDAESLPEDVRAAWDHGSPGSLEVLKEVFKIGLDAGAGTIMLLSDDFVPHEGKNPMNFCLFTLQDKTRFINLQNAQAHVINALKHWLDSDYPGTRFEFCPPWYANEFIDRSEGRAEIYFRELAFQIPGDVAILWTGPTVRSLSVDMADLYRYRQLIGRWPMFWDNTLYARNLETERYGGYATYYPGKVRMCNLFEPLDVDRPADFQQYNDGRQMFVNGGAGSEIFRIKFATVADYEWNTAAYQPERSLWKVLVRSYGRACARELMQFNHAYYGLYAICMRLERGGAKAGLRRRGDGFLAQLRASRTRIAAALSETHPLVEELSDLLSNQTRRFERVSQQG